MLHFVTLVLLLAVTTCQLVLGFSEVPVPSFKLPAGEFTVHFRALERTSPNIKYALASHLRVEDSGFISKVHFMSEDYHGKSFIEYRATRNTQKFVTYERPTDNRCYYATSKDVMSLDVLNNFIESLELVNTKDDSWQKTQVYDKEVYRLLGDGHLQVWMGTLSAIQEEPILVFVESSTGLIKYILSEFLSVEVHLFAAGSSAEVNKMVAHLRSGCTSLDDEFNTNSIIQEKKVVDNRSDSKIPWFLNSEVACESHHIRHDDTCEVIERDEQVVCIFLHGSGEVETREPTNTRENYWGNVHEHTPQCKERWFIWENTRDYGWDSVELQKAYCNLTAFHNKPVEPGAQPIIRNTVVFSHSMGNLILAAAIKNGHCSLGDGSSWYTIDSPYGGSIASAKLQQICYDHHHKTKNLLKKLYGVVAESAGYCIPGTDKAYPAYDSVHPGYCDRDGLCLGDLEEVIREHVKGATCGLSATGLTSKYSVLLGALSTIVSYKESNDGMVGKSSCEKYHAGQFVTNPREKWYASDTNHADGTCRNGNGWWGDDRKPCSFFKDKY